MCIRSIPDGSTKKMQMPDSVRNNIDFGIGTGVFPSKTFADVLIGISMDNVPSPSSQSVSSNCRYDISILVE